MKLLFEEPDIQVILLNGCDVVCGSGCPCDMNAIITSENELEEDTNWP